MYILSGGLPVPYVPVRVTRSASVTRPYNTHLPPRSRTSQYRRTFILFSVHLLDDLDDPIFNYVGLAGFKSMEFFLMELAARSSFAF